jgi:hypothetical protein
MELLHHVTLKTGMAFVIVHHLNSHYSSRLPRLLSKVAAMPLIELTETKIDGAVITLADLEGRKDSYAGKAPRHPK